MNPFKVGDRAFFASNERTEGWQLPSDFRKFMCWIFLATSLQYLTITLRSIPYSTNQIHTAPVLNRLLTAPIISIVMAAISGMAAWTIWKGNRIARVWAVAASLVYILIFFRQFIVPLRPTWDHHAGALVIGMVGLVAFLWPDKEVGS